MDGKMSLIIVFFVCVTLGLQYTSATIPDMTLVTDDGDKKCERKYTTCSLSIDDLPMGGVKGDPGLPGSDGRDRVPGRTGEKGDRGMTGPPGPHGLQGEGGYDGMPGLAGPKGERGEHGERGPEGPPGREGRKGDTGSTGWAGLPGPKGYRGDKGEMGPKGSTGSPGPVGPPGTPGMPGVSGCSLPINTGGDPYETTDDFGTIEKPGEIPCKSAPNGTTSGIYYLGPLFKPMEVYCNMTTLETCISRNIKTPECNYSSSEKAFWLSAKNVHMKELYSYNDTSEEHLTWLRARANSVRQTLKYNCLNSVPYPKHNVSSSVKLWASNDLVIGPYPTTESPVFYSVPEATDNCKEGSIEWQSTIIEVQSSNVYRLPIADLWVGDIRNTAQKMNVESVELCFR